MTRNVLLVTVDSLRADHCGFLGSTDLTPTLDDLASEGVVYENAIAPGPRTPSSMPVTFTGEFLRPEGDGGDDYWEQWRARIRRHMARYRTVAEQFEENGYETVGFTVNPWTQDTGFDAGFDVFRDVNSETLGSYGPPLFRLSDRVLHGNGLGERVKWFNKREWFIRWTDFYDDVLEALDDAEDPYFAWVFLLDTHQPYMAPRASRAESSTAGMYYGTLRELLSNGDGVPRHVETRLERAYRDSIRSVDRFVDRLRTDCGDDDPILVFHSDHGEGFGDHGTYGHQPQLYRENVHVPVLIHDGATRELVPEPFALRQLPQLLEQLAGTREFDPGAFTSEFVVSRTEDDRMLSLSGSTWRYVHNGRDGTEQLYNVPGDPREQTNVAAEYPGVVASLRALANRHRRHLTEQRTIASATTDSGGF